MITRSLIFTLSMVVAGSVMAGEAADRWNTSHAKQQFLATQAAKLNIDISTEEGRVELHAALKDKRIEVAAGLGFDVTTEEGRAAFAEYRHEQRVERASELGFDISTDEGRQEFREYRQEFRAERRELFSDINEDDLLALKEELEGLTRAERHELLKSRIEG